MAQDPTMVAIVKAAQEAGAASCRALYSAGGTIRVWTPLFGVKRAQLEEKLRWVLPSYYEPMVFEDQEKT